VNDDGRMRRVEWGESGACVRGDCGEALAELAESSVHMVLSDIPYGIGAEDWDVLHANANSAYRGASPAQTRAGAVFQRRGKPINGWSQADREIPRQYEEWCRSWAPQWLRVLKPGGSAIVFAGRRLSHRCVVAMEDVGFSYKDSLAWIRPRAPHRAQRASVVFERRGDELNAERWRGWRVGNLRPLYEPVLWFTRPYRIGGTVAENLVTHAVGGYNQDAFEEQTGHTDNVLQIGFDPGEAGLHPTQKPVRLMEALIALASSPGQVVLDPFAGSGSTLVAALRTGRRFVGVERDAGYFETTCSRLNDEQRLRVAT
jgi:site-specific DNA-methyltransferase (adenine-specific)